MDRETASILARTTSATELERQIAMFKDAMADEDDAGIASLTEAIATVREALRLQGA